MMSLKKSSKGCCVKVDRYRPLLAILIVGICFLTNVAHLLAYSNGTVVDYSAKWDNSSINILNLALLGILVVLAVVKPNTEEEA